jgi:hypothetical protein
MYIHVFVNSQLAGARVPVLNTLGSHAIVTLIAGLGAEVENVCQSALLRKPAATLVGPLS